MFVTPLHQPVHLAKSLASLDQLSRGRLQVGVGIGGRVRPFSAFEVEPDDGLVARFNEGLALMKALWTEPTITFDGRFWQLDGDDDGAQAVPEAASAGVVRWQRPDRVCGGPSGTATASSAPGRRRQRRSPNRCRPCGTSWTARSAIRAASGSPSGSTSWWTTMPSGRGSAWLPNWCRIYGEFGRRLEPVAVTGPPDACAAGLRAVADAGAEMILLNTVVEQTEQMERLAAEVMPNVA